jgi:putative ABC transport system permease protein
MNPEQSTRHVGTQQTLLNTRRPMLFSEVLRLVMDSFRTAKLRFALTALGMVIGTASVILVVTIGLSGKQYVLQELQKLETNSIEVEYAGGGITGTEQSVYDDYLTLDDERAVETQLPGVVYASPVLVMLAPITFGQGVVKDVRILGVSPQYRSIRNLLLPDGRFFDDFDDSARCKCAVVTQVFARERFGSPQSAIGRIFEINGIPFTIIGVFRESVDDLGVSEISDQTILIPFSVGRSLSGSGNVMQMYFSVRTMDEVPGAAKEIQRVIEARHRPNSVYKTETLKEMLATAGQIANALTAVLVLLATVTLAVGGVGIMNIMLANVRERVREIGIRKALGATYQQIKLQFLTEAVIISLTGGLVGTFIGLTIPLSIRLFTDYSPPITVWSVVVALSAAILVGVIFGTVPATRAAQLDPVESLKFE